LPNFSSFFIDLLPYLPGFDIIQILNDISHKHSSGRDILLNGANDDGKILSAKNR